MDNHGSDPRCHQLPYKRVQVGCRAQGYLGTYVIPTESIQVTQPWKSMCVYVMSGVHCAECYTEAGATVCCALTAVPLNRFAFCVSFKFKEGLLGAQNLSCTHLNSNRLQTLDAYIKPNEQTDEKRKQ